MKYLVTGAAGFIASKTAEFLLNDGHEVIGVDNLNDYYDVNLKKHRLENLLSKKNFEFLRLDIEDKGALSDLFNKHRFDAVLNLAARAGVRYSMENPDQCDGDLEFDGGNEEARSEKNCACFNLIPICWTGNAVQRIFGSKYTYFPLCSF
jgi:NAD(P)-dependent dehydrogenase (short-subunit alcohol dehydrogenase family)